MNDRTMENIKKEKKHSLPKGWEIKKLGEVCEMYQPKTISTKEMVDDGQYPVFGANGIIGKYDKYNHEEPQLLITCRGATCGSVNISEPKSWINGNAMVVRPKDHSIDLKFLEYLFRGGIDLSKTITGAAQPQITRQSLIPIEISYPKSLPEQQRIVAILDETFSAIDKAKANAEQNLKNAKELFESYLQGVFEKKGNGWEEKKLGEVYDVRDGTHDSPKYHNQGYPLVTSKNLKNHKLTFDNIKFISETDYLNINKRSKVDVGDVLFAMIGTIGNPVVIEDEPNYAIKNVALFKVGNNQNSYFLKYFLDSKQTIEKMMRDAKGTTQKFVGLGYLRSFPILVPPLKEQQTIVRQLDTLRIETQKLESIYQKKILLLEELKKSILQKAFSGELN